MYASYEYWQNAHLPWVSNIQMCVCVCVVLCAGAYSVLWERRLRKPEETSSHLSSILSVVLLHLFCSVIASQSLCGSKSSCFSPTLSVSCGASTNDGSVSAQSAVTETSLPAYCLCRLSLFHCCDPSLCLLCSVSFSQLWCFDSLNLPLLISSHPLHPLLPVGWWLH